MGCLVVLFVIIALIISLITSCVSKKHSDDDVITQPANAQTQQTEVTTEEDDGKFIVCLDPGHGGSDPGSNYGERLEKDDNLRYALAVAEELKKREGINVIMTRINDNVPDADNFDSAARGKIANDAGADLFLALHRNCAEDTSGNGVEVWIKKNPPIVDQVLGYNLIKYLSAVGIQSNRGVNSGFRTDEQDNFTIMDSINMSGCLLELGFISNDEDNRLFDENMQKYAVAIADVIEYIYISYYK